MKVLVTTSREPSRRTRSFLNDLVKVIPWSIKFTRGKATLKDLLLAGLRLRAYGIIIIMEQKANPSALVFHQVEEKDLVKKYLLKIGSVKLRREIYGSQEPFNIKSLYLNPQKIPLGFPQLVGNVLIEVFRPRVTSEFLESSATISIIIGGDQEKASVSFICTSTERVCGPQFKVFKVFSYGEKGRSKH